MEKVLKTRPSGLTRLSSRNGGVYPADRVFRSIDGRQVIRGHGPQEMPVWGLTFRVTESSDRAEVEERIWDLVAYLRSLQKPDEAAAISNPGS